MWRKIKNLGHLLEAITANVMYGFPSHGLRILAITGTDGKTTTATLLYHILKLAGKKAALVSTVAAYIGHDEIDTGFHVTNPSPFALQKLLARCRKEQVEFVVLEITSHGIDQYRNWGIKPELAAITNVTHEHLDYHKTFENYLETKAKLLISASHAFLNNDATGSFQMLAEILRRAKVAFTPVSVSALSPAMTKAVHKRFGPEAYNSENVALASGMAKSLGLDESLIVSAIASFPGVKGRMEPIKNELGLNLIVDFAHTPNALEQALKSIRARMGRKKKKGKLILVFGSAGLRDASKRPLMGKAAVELADLAVFTAEDPRTEDVWTIINQLKSGVMTGHDRIVSIADRYQAIKFAIKTLAFKGDTVLITGKGHEQSMNLGGVEYNWSDAKAVAKVLANEDKF